MVTHALRSLQEIWQGPAVTVTVNSRTYQLGQGTPEAVVQVHHEKALWRLPYTPSLAFGEAYMRGDVTIEGNLLALLKGYYQTSLAWGTQSNRKLLRALRPVSHRRTSSQRAIAYARHHYDLGNEFYRLWLDPALIYSCAYFATPQDSLAQAQ